MPSIVGFGMLIHTKSRRTNKINNTMEKFRVLGCGLAYIVLAGISCWATEQSLHLLLPAGWPEILVWGITIAFFVVASIGTWLITSTLASSWSFVDNRKLRIFGGFLLVIFFWLLYEYADEYSYVFL